MAELALEAVLGRLAFEPGERAEFRVTFALPSVPSSLELRLYWHTRGRGDTNSAEAAALEHQPGTASGEWLAELELPAAPHSFDGKLVAIQWELEVVALPSKLHANRQLVIAPGARALQPDELE